MLARHWQIVRAHHYTTVSYYTYSDSIFSSQLEISAICLSDSSEEDVNRAAHHARPSVRFFVARPIVFRARKFPDIWWRTSHCYDFSFSCVVSVWSDMGNTFSKHHHYFTRDFGTSLSEIRCSWAPAHKGTLKIENQGWSLDKIAKFFYTIKSQSPSI